MKRVCGMAVMLMLCFLCLTAGRIHAGAEGTEELVVYSRIYDYAVVQGTSKLNMRLGPDVSYDWIGAAKPGDWVGILGEQDKWYYAYIQELNQYGYMSKSYLLMNDETGIPAEGVISNPQAGAQTVLRSFPAYQAQALKTCENGTPLKLVSASSDGWYEVEIDGEKGYLRCETVRLKEAAGAGMAEIQGVNGGTILMRDKPFFLGAQVIGRFPSGSQAAVLLETPAEDSFYKIVVNGTQGYVLKRFITEENKSDAAYDHCENALVALQGKPAFLNLRDQPSEHAKVLARCANAAELKVISQGEIWSKVYDNATGNVGYCFTKGISAAQNPSANIREVSKWDVEMHLNLSPDKPGKHSITLGKGAKVTVLTPGDQWSNVRYAGITGYVQTEYLQ